MNYRYYPSIICIVILFVLGGCGSKSVEVQGQEPEGTQLTVYCGAGLKNIMTEIAEDYEAETGVKVSFIFNGSGMLLGQIKTTETGDLFIPGELSFIEKLKEDNGEAYVVEQKELFANVPVILLNEKGIDQVASLEDLGKEGVAIALGDENIAIGKLFKQVLEKNDLAEVLADNTLVRFATVNQVVSAVEMKQVDAGVAFYLNYVDCDHEVISMVEIPKEQNVTQKVAIAVLGCSEHREAALNFMNYVANEGSDVYERYDYQ